MGALVKTVVESTGLPQDSVEKELNSLLERLGKSPETLTMEELREVMAEYLQMVFLEIHEEIST